VAGEQSQHLAARVAACASDSDGKRHFSTLMRVDEQGPEAATLRDQLTGKVSGAASPKVGAHAEQLGDGCP